MEIIRRRLLVHGHVQGVFFRDSTRERARREGVAGWAHNRSDGAVEVVLEGERDAVERVSAFVRSGPRGAHVERVDAREERSEGLDGFEIR
jgi:acylphosphatase